MTSASRGKKPKRQTRKPIKKGKLPLSVTLKDGKTTVQKYVDRRFVRFGEFRGKTVASVELLTSEQDSHSLTVYFQDRTVWNLLISPGFTITAEYYKNQGLSGPSRTEALAGDQKRTAILTKKLSMARVSASSLTSTLFCLI
jgi:hypothetical protein